MALCDPLRGLWRRLWCDAHDEQSLHTSSASRRTFQNEANRRRRSLLVSAGRGPARFVACTRISPQNHHSSALTKCFHLSGRETSPLRLPRSFQEDTTRPERAIRTRSSRCTWALRRRPKARRHRRRPAPLHAGRCARHRRRVVQPDFNSANAPSPGFQGTAARGALVHRLHPGKLRGEAIYHAGDDHVEHKKRADDPVDDEEKARVLGGHRHKSVDERVPVVADQAAEEQHNSSSVVVQVDGVVAKVLPIIFLVRAVSCGPVRGVEQRRVLVAGWVEVDEAAVDVHAKGDEGQRHDREQQEGASRVAKHGNEDLRKLPNGLEPRQEPEQPKRSHQDDVPEQPRIVEVVGVEDDRNGGHAQAGDEQVKLVPKVPPVSPQAHREDLQGRLAGKHDTEENVHDNLPGLAGVGGLVRVAFEVGPELDHHHDGVDGENQIDDVFKIGVQHDPPQKLRASPKAGRPVLKSGLGLLADANLHDRHDHVELAPFEHVAAVVVEDREDDAVDGRRHIRDDQEPVEVPHEREELVFRHVRLASAALGGVFQGLLRIMLFSLAAVLDRTVDHVIRWQGLVLGRQRLERPLHGLQLVLPALGLPRAVVVNVDVEHERGQHVEEDEEADDQVQKEVDEVPPVVVVGGHAEVRPVVRREQNLQLPERLAEVREVAPSTRV
eukprot:scaffold1874_cov237-Pinguiococcus_pyrenoidosus.AAC.1